MTTRSRRAWANYAPWTPPPSPPGGIILTEWRARCAFSCYVYFARAQLAYYTFEQLVFDPAGKSCLRYWARVIKSWKLLVIIRENSQVSIRGGLFEFQAEESRMRGAGTTLVCGGLASIREGAAVAAYTQSRSTSAFDFELLGLRVSPGVPEILMRFL